jgi:hypothetical protein
MIRSSRKIKSEYIVDIESKLREMSFPRQVYILPEKESPNWIQRVLIDRVWSTIRKALSVSASVRTTGGSLYLDILIQVAGRKLLQERIKIV